MLDCIVVGAGLAGLRTATELVAAGREVLVLEARDRVGGRVETIRTEHGAALEMGGQWINDGHERMIAMVEERDLTLVDHADGAVVVRLGGGRRHVPTKDELDENLSPFELADLGQGLLRFRRLGERISHDAAWADANRPWFQQSVETWVSANVRTPGGQQWFGRVFEGAFGRPGDEMTLLEGLQRSNNRLDLESLVTVNGALKQRRVAGGIAQLCEAMAADLGDRLQLGAPVVAVEQDDEQVVVVLADGTRHQAAHLVLTLPPRLVNGLKFTPELPTWRRETAEKVPAGNVIKAALIYETPWWRREGMSGQVGSDEGAMRVIMDNSGPDGHGVLMGFFEGPDAPSIATRSEFLRQRAMENVVKQALGHDGGEPLAYLDRNWSTEQYTGGCHGAHFAPGVWTASGPVLAEPEGRVYFAGSEYSSKFNGYMEGAVRSAERIAKLLLRG